eukprot:6190649-Pleurochrysis_carterae.AAC.1
MDLRLCVEVKGDGVGRPGALRAAVERDGEADGADWSRVGRQHELQACGVEQRRRVDDARRAHHQLALAKVGKVGPTQLDGVVGGERPAYRRHAQDAHGGEVVLIEDRRTVDACWCCVEAVEQHGDGVAARHPRCGRGALDGACAERSQRRVDDFVRSAEATLAAAQPWVDEAAARDRERDGRAGRRAAQQRQIDLGIVGCEVAARRREALAVCRDCDLVASGAISLRVWETRLETAQGGRRRVERGGGADETAKTAADGAVVGKDAARVDDEGVGDDERRERANDERERDRAYRVDRRRGARDQSVADEGRRRLTKLAETARERRAVGTQEGEASAADLQLAAAERGGAAREHAVDAHNGRADIRKQHEGRGADGSAQKVPLVAERFRAFGDKVRGDLAVGNAAERRGGSRVAAGRAGVHPLGVVTVGQVLTKQ